MSHPAVKLLFESFSDLALLPALVHIFKRRRHFELFIAVSMVASSFLYNTCNAFNTSIFLDETTWHEMNNILAPTYFLLMGVHVAHLNDEMVNCALRYAIFASVTLAQLKDGFWMTQTQYTYIPCALFGLIPLVRVCDPSLHSSADKQRIVYGAAYGFLAAILFKVSQNDTFDSLRFFRGLAHVSGGAGVWYFWQVAAADQTGKKSDDAKIPKTHDIFQWC
jgi:hypothetical protein